MLQPDKYLDLPLEDVIGDRFGRYSKYIIQERALPDARDGLKPVQRRILYSMHKEGNTADKPFRKSAKTVGNVIGNYHPHGDTSVYDAMIRMSQDWKVRYGLVQMHGNNGSIDGDPPAAMRYTEARLAAISTQMMRDIEKDTVDFIPNFDDSDTEPVVLPAMFPNLLVNGSTGISAGYATDIPPHQLGEVIDAAVLQMESPNCTLNELLEIVKGPDFPTGGTIQGAQGIRQAYETGKGKVVVRCKSEIDTIRGGKQQIIITEIPFEIVKSNLVKKMDEIRFDKKVEGIAEVRDDTDRTGLRIVIELKKDANAEAILNYLYKNTDLQITYNFNMVAIFNKRPVLLGLKQLLEAYINHQKEVITRRSAHELLKSEERKHIVEGLIRAISILDEVIAAIRASKDKRDAKDNLMSKFQFTDAQAEAIVSLQLYRLTNTDVTTLQKESDELDKKITQLTEILSSPKKLIQVIKKDLLTIKKTFNDERRTVIEAEIEEIKIDFEVLLPPEEVIVTVTKEGYVKRTSVRSFTASNGDPFGMKEGDRAIGQFETSTTDTLLIFSSKGNYLFIPVRQLPDIRWKDLGQHVANIVPLERGDEIIKAIPIKEFKDDQYLIFFTKSGMAKRTAISEYQAQRHSKPLMALKLKQDDVVVDLHLTDGSQDVFISTAFGYGLLFEEAEISVVGQRATGVKGINLKAGDDLISGFTLNNQEKQHLFVVTHRGAFKKMNVTEFEKSSRAKRGLIMLRELKSNPHRLIALKKADNKSIFHLKTDKGLEEIVEASQIRASDRYSNGSFIIDITKDGAIIDLWEQRKKDEENKKPE
ncbi:DNA topoisomerase IV subunit A [Bacillaceae bacterium IKA-2]|nr:DNA topoisomerase IV subunit A [Bacillaceae bacterium IKA-2]